MVILPNMFAEYLYEPSFIDFACENLNVFDISRKLHELHQLLIRLNELS